MKLSSRRAFFHALAVTSAATLVAACSGAPLTPGEPPKVGAPESRAPAASAKPARSGPREISIATSWTGTSEKKIWEQLTTRFNQKNPDISVRLDLSSAQGAYDQNLIDQVAAGTIPDIVLTSDNYVEPFKKNKITRDMIPFAKATRFPYQDFDKSFLDLGIVEGELHMLPRGGDVVVLFVNKKLARDASVEIPWTVDPASDTWTKEEFDKVTRRLALDSKGKRGDEAGFDKTSVSVYGAAVTSNWWAVYVPAILAEGGEIVSADLSKSLINSGEAARAFDWLTRGKIDGYWAPTSLIKTVGGEVAAWTSGKAAVIMTVRTAIPGLRDKIADDWDVAHFPRGATKRVTGMGTFGFGLTAASKHTDDAWTYLDWMYGEEGMTIVAQSYGSVPAQKRFYKSSFWRNLPPPPGNNDVFVDAFAYGTLPPRLPFYTSGPFTKAIDDGLESIELGKMTPIDVVKNVDAELSKWLAQNKK
jgi:multiple sugar transport system substrate-binding protein